MNTTIHSAAVAVTTAAFSKSLNAREASRAVDAIHAALFETGTVRLEVASETLKTIAATVRTMVMERNIVVMSNGLPPANPDNANGTVKAIAAAINKVKKHAGDLTIEADTISAHNDGKLTVSAWRKWAGAMVNDTASEETGHADAGAGALPAEPTGEVINPQFEALTADIAAIRAHWHLAETDRLSACVDIARSDVAALRAMLADMTAERDAHRNMVAALSAQLTEATAKRTAKRKTATV